MLIRRFSYQDASSLSRYPVPGDVSSSYSLGLFWWANCVSTLTRTLPNLGTMLDELPIPRPMPSQLQNTVTCGTFAFLDDTSAPSSSSSNPAESTYPSDGLGRNQLEAEVEVLTKEQKLQAMAIVIVGQKLDASVKHIIATKPLAS
ncbi:Os08g0255000 [Oryza sativa Japonica Group]|uniref:Os08g0255000 protein n=1 Tax=Oryza sativa subsp. japonica TaxID=39947 RepID=C7J5Q6_ORYSJ|nr:Os08g0255000 [Oryza sativa Japonica Group]|eukprot:NP_001175477.1 Os08g0255000 [Oryza sativa Japonica Group]